MGIINVLDKHTANLIAAGEVVERPASAVKEMLENCADAGATSVTVEIKDGGTSFVRITDDGCGIAREDVPKTILRHATSKIKTGSDLSTHFFSFSKNFYLLFSKKHLFSGNSTCIF